MNGKIRTIVVGSAAISDQDPHERPSGEDPVLAPAAALAASLGARLHVVHAFTLPERLFAALENGAWEAEARRSYVAAVKDRLQSQMATLPRIPDFCCHAVIGSPGAALLKQAEEVGADLIVVGASRRGRLWRSILGATASHVLRDARIPVLVVHQPFEGPVQRVIVATDLSDGSAGVYEREMDALATLAPGSALDVRIVHVVELDPMLEAPASDEVLLGTAKRLLTEFIAQRRPRPWQGEPVVRRGDVAQELAREAEEWDADLVVLGSQAGMQILPTGLGGSATSAIRHVACNALVVPADPLGLDLGCEPVLIGRALFEECEP